MEVQVIKRRVSPAQKQRRELIIASARDLLAQHGGAISMEVVAEASGTSRSTLYRNFSSREHLIAEVTLDAGHRLIALIEQQPPQGDTVGERIASLCHYISALAGANTALLGACVYNMSSTDPAVVEAQADIEQLISGFFSTALGEEPFEDNGQAQEIIFRYLLGSFMLATTEKLDFERIAGELTALCQGLLGDSWSRKVA